MKPNRKNLLLAAISLTLSAPSVFAADLTWDAGNTANGATIDAASGNWNTTAGNIVWNNASTNVIWSQVNANDASNAAIFAGADGTLLAPHTVTISGTMAAEAITFNSSHYVITGGTLAIKPASTGNNGPIVVAANKTATINSAIAYNNNTGASITAQSGAVLNLGGGASNAQYAFTGAGTVNITGGTYIANIGSMNVATFNQSGGTFTVNPGDNNGYTIGNNPGQNVNYTLSGTATLLARNNAGSGTGGNISFLRLGNATTTAFTSTLTVKNDATMTVGSGKYGELQIAGSTDSNGKLDVQGGTVTIAAGVPAANKIYFFKNGSSSGYSATMTQSGGTVTANGIQFGGDTGTYDAGSSASLTLSGGSLYVGAQGITRGLAAGALPTSVKLQGGTLGASADWSSSLDMQVKGGITVQAANSGGLARNITLSGVLSNDVAPSGSFFKTGTGTLTLSNDANTFTAQVLSDSGTIQVTKLADNGQASSIGAGTAPIRLGNDATATLEYIGTSDSSTNKVIQIGTNNNTNTGSATILNNGTGKLTFTATTFNANAGGGTTVARALTLGGTYTGAANEITGVIQDHNTAGGGTVSLTKEGASTWKLSGANTYTGATNVNGGTLIINGSTSTSIVTVGASGTLGGSGTVGGATTVNGTFSPGQSPGTMEFENTLTLVGSTIMEIDGNSGAGVTGGHDFVNLTGAGGAGVLTYGGTMTIDIGTMFGVGSYSWNLFDFASESGTFTSITLADQYSGSLTDAGGGNWGLTSGNQTWSFTESTGFLDLTVIPEPGAALLGGLGLLALLRRRRH
jgi:autotransporter-associated beta strand protein